MNSEQYFADDNPYSDPPDIYELFQFYNSYFFQSRLMSSSIHWSKRMTLCAGTCKYEGQRSCVITLSEPLLKYRSNNELKETILHEMIHAFLFITCPGAEKIDEGHGPQFLELMHKINNKTGLKISVFHQFHDEVDRCRNHIWRCNGKCQQDPPFYGFVKRAMNRPPGKGDNWFFKHNLECGGEFIKISQPEKIIKVQKRKEKVQKQIEPKQISISKYFQKPPELSPQQEQQQKKVYTQFEEQLQQQKQQQFVLIQQQQQQQQQYLCYLVDIIRKNVKYMINLRIQVQQTMNLDEFMKKINLVYQEIGKTLQEEEIFQVVENGEISDLLSYLKRNGKILDESRLGDKQMIILRLKIGWEQECVELLGKLNELLL